LGGLRNTGHGQQEKGELFPDGRLANRLAGRARWAQAIRLSLEEGEEMTVARITEISSVSNKSFQDAVEQGVERANNTLRNVKGAWVQDQEVKVENGKVTGYKVILKVTFVLD
jgi:flavin-binding protein dodecin